MSARNGGQITAKKRPRRSHKEKFEMLTINVDTFDQCVHAAVNHVVYAPQYAFHLDLDDPLYTFTSQLVVSGIAAYPKNRTGDRFELTFYGDDKTSRNLSAKLASVQKRDDYGSPEYRAYRGDELPVFDPPNGIGYMEKVRGENEWHATLFVSMGFVSDAFAVLSNDRPKYIELHERQLGRNRSVRGVSIQTIDPLI